LDGIREDASTPIWQAMPRTVRKTVVVIFTLTMVLFFEDIFDLPAADSVKSHHICKLANTKQLSEAVAGITWGFVTFGLVAYAGSLL